MAKKRTVITGLGVVSPIGIGKKQFWQNILNGVSGVKPVSIFKTFDKAYSLVGEVADLDFSSYL
ncbi:MAG: beta-ketoacyl synthase N-terminal-like domain-containing protein, partial [Candidatus Omnitrophota bacterium]